MTSCKCTKPELGQTTTTYYFECKKCGHHADCHIETGNIFRPWKCIGNERHQRCFGIMGERL